MLPRASGLRYQFWRHTLTVNRTLVWGTCMTPWRAYFCTLYWISKQNDLSHFCKNLWFIFSVCSKNLQINLNLIFTEATFCFLAAIYYNTALMHTWCIPIKKSINFSDAHAYKIIWNIYKICIFMPTCWVLFRCVPVIVHYSTPLYK